MNSYIDPSDMQQALQRAHKIRSDAVHESLRMGRRRISELFHSYNPQKRFRR